MTRYPSPYGGPPQGQPYGLDYGVAQEGAIVGRFFNAVYGWMAAGLALTAVVAWDVSPPPALLQTGFSPRGLIGLLIAELVLVFTVSAAVNRLSSGVATALFLLYAALNGLTLSGLLLIYTHATIASAFLVTAGMFGAMSVYGMVTRRDLSGWGSVLFMGLIGLILASVVSIFWHNTVLTVLINYVGVLIFVGLTAYDTQRLKMIALQTAGAPEVAARWAINGALSLYLDFLNLFLMLLRIMGDR